MTYYDRAGQPISIDEWSERFADMKYKRVAETVVGDARVSTVWLGLDHSFGSGPLLIFETMIFAASPLNGEQWRYSTEAQALAGHAEAVTLARHELELTTTTATEEDTDV